MPSKNSLDLEGQLLVDLSRRFHICFSPHEGMTSTIEDVLNGFLSPRKACPTLVGVYERIWRSTALGCSEVKGITPGLSC